MANKKSNKINPVILVLICACLLFAAYTSLSTIALGLWGSTVMGTVDSYDSRLDDTDAGANCSRTISKGYFFTADGRQYRGHVLYAGDEAWPRLEQGQTRTERINYFSFCPYINKPAALTNFDRMGAAGLLYHFLSPATCVLLLLLVTGTLKRKKKRKRAAKKTATPLDNNTRSDTDMFCPNCKNKLPESAAFCPNCGAKTQNCVPGLCAQCGAAIPEGADFCPNCGATANAAGTTAAPPQTSRAPAQTSAAARTGLTGFSERYTSPEILAAAQKNKKTSIGCMWILVLVPLAGFIIAGLLMDDFPFGEALVIGVGIAVVMLIVNLIALKRTKKPIWEGTVINKYKKEKYEHRGSDDDNYRTYTEYTTVIRTDAGRKKTIVEKDSGRDMYDYLSVGDRLRYHPAFGTYEKYDKSKDRIIYCNVCRMMNPIENERCKRCNNLIFK